MKIILLICGLLVSTTGLAQTYSLGRCKVAGGGGMNSTGGVYTVSGTAGQPDASAQPLAGGGYSVSGGFWSVISVVQTVGAPSLTITHDGNSVIISWPNTGNYTLQQNSNLAVSSGWVTSSYSITATNGVNSIIITSPAGNVFFRLKQ